MIGSVFGQYEIISKLGEGGMGVVYRARDRVLERDVALKFLGEKLDPNSQQRLVREARAASALSHPNICTVHEVGEAEGESYIVMELIEGAPLGSLIHEGGMSYQSVMRYGTQIAAALSHAHARNIVHRDLKSSNVMVTPEGLVKVLDFGLAIRVTTEAEGERATRSMDSLGSSTTGGTLSYMSPEVLRGEPGDYRSDLWAFGVLLYEALSGEMPFRGRTTFEVSSSILNEAPTPLPSRTPAGLVAIVLRCLTKEPGLRYQRASEVQAALEAVQSASILPAPTGGHRGVRTFVHRGTKPIAVKDGDVLLLVGTMKGAFLLRSPAERMRWEMAGPYFPGQATYALAWDSRQGRHRLWASTYSALWGAFLRSSDDYGRTWTEPNEAPIRFPADSGVSLKNIWQICPGTAADPNTLYCGVEPAALFESRDDGETWSLVRGLFDHPHRPRWASGMGGLTLHTILVDEQNPDRMYVAISAGGVYATEDGGRTWQARNRGIRVVFAPERYPEFGQCVHKIAMHPFRPERIFLQNHWGLYRSDDCGVSWQDIANGVPSDFGFAVAVHPRNPDCVYVVPIESDEFRCTPEGRLRVYRTRNAGESWESLARGLPQKDAYETILRDGMATDSLNPSGIYFGTRSGRLYGSRDEGRSWEKLIEGLPPIVCVKTAVIGAAGATGAPARKPARADQRSSPGASPKPKAKR